MKKNSLILSLAILILILGYSIQVNRNKLLNYFRVTRNITDSFKPEGFSLPVPQNSKNVTGVSVHYFFTGTLSELKKVSLGTQIIYNNPDTSLPDLIATTQTRISKITPPYEKNHIKIDIEELKSGQTIGISAELNIATNTWSVLDVYLATDKN